MPNTVENQELHNKVYKTLEQKIKEDQDFQNELEYLSFFYRRKLTSIVKDTQVMEYIFRQFDDVLFSQFFQGYYAMTILLEDEEEHFSEKDWNHLPGLVRNEIPKFLKMITKVENVNWTHTEIGHNFSMDILQSAENAYDVTQLLLSDLTNYGAYKAFIDDKRYVGEKNLVESEMLLGNAFDLNFVTPQVYMQAQFFTEQHELWDLFNWSAIGEGAWVGSIHYSVLPIEEQTYYVLEFSLSNLINKDEQMEIVNDVIKKIPEEIRSTLQTRLYSVSELDVLIASE